MSNFKHTLLAGINLDHTVRSDWDSGRRSNPAGVPTRGAPHGRTPPQSRLVGSGRGVTHRPQSPLKTLRQPWRGLVATVPAAVTSLRPPRSGPTRTPCYVSSAVINTHTYRLGLYLRKTGPEADEVLAQDAAAAFFTTVRCGEERGQD